MNRIEAQWRTFEEIALRSDASTPTRRACRMVFFSGAVAMFSLAKGLSAQERADLEQEIQDFKKEVFLNLPNTGSIS